MKYKSLFFHYSALCLLILSYFCVFATPATALSINEIYSSPSTGASEWVELFNETSSDVNLSDYTLIDIANNKITLPAQTIAPGSYISVTSASVLNNSGDTITLSSASFSQVVTFPALTSTESFASCATSSASFVKTTQITRDLTNPANLCITSSPSATTVPSSPTAEPSNFPSATTFPSSSPVQSSPIPSKTPTPTPTPLYLIGSNKIIISEVFPSPEEGEHEWIEFYNPESKDVLLSAWKIDDILSGGSTPISIDIYLLAHSFTSYELPKTMLNNTGDSVFLLDKNDKTIDSMDFASTTLGQSWSATSLEQNTSYCSTTASPDKTNFACESSSSESNNTITSPVLSPTSTTTSSDASYTSEDILPTLMNYQSQNINFDNLQSKRFAIQNLQNSSNDTVPSEGGRVLGASSDGENNASSKDKSRFKVSFTLLLIVISSAFSIITLYLYQYENISQYAQKIKVRFFS